MATNHKEMIVPPAASRKLALRPSEVAIVAFLLWMNLVSWVGLESIPNATRGSLAAVTILFLLSAIAIGEHQTGWRYWARELLPVPVIPYIFLTLGRLIPVVNRQVLDYTLIAWDRTLLGVEAQEALYAISLPPWLADLLTVAYSTFLLLPIILAVTLAARRDPMLPRVTSAVVFAFLLSYAGYFLVPAYGPRATVASQRYATLPQGLVGAPIRELLDHWEKTKTDAFPSGHTMVTLAVLYCARRRVTWLYQALLPVGALLIAATVLLTYHYVVDVLAAVPLTALALFAAARCHGPVLAAKTAQRLPPS